jgi:hypothetical protein
MERSRTPRLRQPLPPRVVPIVVITHAATKISAVTCDTGYRGCSAAIARIPANPRRVTQAAVAIPAVVTRIHNVATAAAPTIIGPGGPAVIMIVVARAIPVIPAVMGDRAYSAVCEGFSTDETIAVAAMAAPAAALAAPAILAPHLRSLHRAARRSKHRRRCPPCRRHRRSNKSNFKISRP